MAISRAAHGAHLRSGGARSSAAPPQDGAARAARRAAEQGEGQRGLPAAGFAQQSDRLAGVDGEGHAIDGREPAELHPEVAHIEQGRGFSQVCILARMGFGAARSLHASPPRPNEFIAGNA